MSGGDYARAANTIDLLDDQTFIVANNVAALRAWVSNAKRSLAALTKNMSVYRQIEKSMMRVSYRYTDAEIEKRSSDNNMSVSEIQARASSAPVKPADQNIAYSTNRAKDETPGIRGVESSQTDISELIKVTNAQINQYEKGLSRVQSILNDPVATAAMAEDRIYRSRMFGLNQLYFLHVNYRMMTTAPDGKTRPFYPENDSKSAAEIVRMRALFNGQSAAFPTLDKQLDHIDIGSDSNDTLLKAELEKYRVAGTVGNAATVLVAGVTKATKFLSDVMATAMDRSASKNIARVPPPTLAQSNSMKARTASYPGAVVNLWGEGVYQGTSWSVPDLKSSIEMAWKKGISKNYRALPKCTVTPPTTADKSKATAQAANAKAEATAIENFNKKMAKATALSSESQKESIASQNAQLGEIKAILSKPNGGLLETFPDPIQVQTNTTVATLNSYTVRDFEARNSVSKMESDGIALVRSGLLLDNDRLTLISEAVTVYQQKAVSHPENAFD